MRYMPYVPKSSYVLTKSHWVSYRFCDWFWSDAYFGDC